MPLIINRNTNYTITRGSSVVLSKGLLLDFFRNAAAAYSLRKLRFLYNGAAIRVRRSSDNTEQDIGFTYDELDTNQLSSFVGAGNGFVTTWYDQSVNGRNLTQTTAANQPLIVNAGSIQTINNKPAVYFDTTAKSLSIAYGFPGANSFIFDVLQTNDTTFLVYHGASGGLTFVSVGNSGDSNALINSNATVSNYYRNGALQTAPTTRIGVYNLVSTNSQIILTHQLQLTSWPAFIISGYTSYEFIHYKSELIIFNTDQTSNRTGIESNINSYYNGIWAGASSKLLNTYTGSAAAYSLRNLSSTYTGPLIRVRRASDNAETDVYGTSAGGLDIFNLLTFVGSSSGYVTTWYDQSGNGRNITQTTALNQPYIVSLGVLNTANGRPALFFTLNDANRLTRSGIISGSTARTQIAVYKPATTTGVSGIFGQGFDAGTGTWSYIQSRTGAATGDPYFAGYSADLGNGLTAKDTTLKIGSFMYNGTTGYLWKNNTQVTSGNLTLNTDVNQILQIGNSGGGTGTSNELLQGSIFECILYLSDNLANISAINADINSYYSIY